ncbi:MAG: MarR family transcriptional regulator [Flavobacteriales bacterium]|nr:MarR family transcriptional regulator [Flavobacteriales bacterium]HRW90241.1 MarR family transcriptional regulator [Flavobacteriales bacterium]
MADLKDHFNRCLFFAAAATTRMLSRMSQEEFQKHDLSSTQGFILIIVKTAPGIIVTDLSSVLQLDQTTVTKTLNKMAGIGLLTREPFGKLVRVFLTEKGLQRELDAQAAWDKLQLRYNLAIGQAIARSLTEGLVHAQDSLEVESR